MSDAEQPQIYLITPPVLELSTFPTELAKVLDAHEVACIRLALASHDEDQIARAADACREVAHARDIAIVVNDHTELAIRLGLDGVHLSDAGRSVRDARKSLGPDAIVGSHCAASRHDGISAGEAGADYVSFGPVTGSTGDGQLADTDLFTWWSEMIEVPVVAEGALDLNTIRTLSPVSDFFGIGEEIWSTTDPAGTLGGFIAAMQ
ncbi:MAG: thiamine phosphate synthase [Lentilitoribacter sp.]